MLAAGLQNRKNHQVRVRKKPFFRLGAGRLGNAGQCPKVLVSGEATQMIEADSSQRGNFVFGEDLLA